MLNMENLNKANEWAENVVYTWTLDNIYGSVAKVAFVLWFPRFPRNFDTVMKEFMEKCRTIPEVRSVVSVQLIDATLFDLVDRIYDILMSIDEFQKWNLTDSEYQHDVDPNVADYNDYFRHGNFFVDLGAFKQNIYWELRRLLIEEIFFEGGCNEKA